MSSLLLARVAVHEALQVQRILVRYFQRDFECERDGGIEETGRCPENADVFTISRPSDDVVA